MEEERPRDARRGPPGVPLHRRSTKGSRTVSFSAVRVTAAIAHEAPWYVARCLKVEVTSQGRSVEEAIDNLREAVGQRELSDLAALLRQGDDR